jgi:hypothetical protein
MIALSSLTDDARLHFGATCIMTTESYDGIATRVFMVRHGVAVLSAFAESFFGLCKLRFSLDIEAVTFS